MSHITPILFPLFCIFLIATFKIPWASTTSADYCEYKGDVNETESDFLTNRARQCYKCRGREGEDCWMDPPSPKGKFDLCGFMGDEACMCVQEWRHLEMANFPKTVNRLCLNFDDIDFNYGLTQEEVTKMGCEKLRKSDNELVEVCFCETDKCNHDEKYTSQGARVTTNLIWKWIGSVLVMQLMRYW